MTDSRPVMKQYNELLGILGRFTQHKMNMDETNQVSCIIGKLPPSWKDFKHTLKHKKEEFTLVELSSHLHIEESLRVQDVDPSVVNMCGKLGHLKKDCKCGKVGNKANGSGTKGLVDASSNSMKALLHGRGCVDLRFSSGKIISLLNVLYVPNIRKNLVSSSVSNNCSYKQVIESNKFVLSKHGVFIGFGYLPNHMSRLNIVNDNISSAFMSTSKLNDLILWHARLGHVHFKRMQDMSKDGLIPAFDMDTEKCKTCMLTKITKKPFQNVKRKTEVLELIHSDLCGLHATLSLENKKYFVTFIDDALRTESRVLGAVVRLFDPKLKILGERGIECIFVGYVDLSKAFRKLKVDGTIEKFKARLVLHGFKQMKGTRDEVSDQHSYCFNVEDDPKTFDEAIKSQDVAFWKEAINDEIDSIIKQTGCWLSTPGCNTFGCKWIFKRKLKEVDIIKKAENQAKMTKLSMEWKRLCKIKAKVQKCQSQSQYRRISSQTGAGTEEYY
ncbi:zinc finger, CCHC-type containing protein [Tanacetum coccineum]